MTLKLSIRAITLMLPLEPHEFLEDHKLREMARSLPRIIKNIIKGIPVISVRLAFKPIRPNKVSLGLFKEIERLAKSLGFNYVAVPLLLDNEKGYSKIIIEELMETDTVFIGINPSEDINLLEISKVYAEMLIYLLDFGASEIGARVSLVLRGPLMTPYFPAAACIHNRPSICAALLYPDFLLEQISTGVNIVNAIERACRIIEKRVYGVAKSIGVDYAGLDISISPWMEQSVMRLISVYHHVDITTEAGFHAIYSLNQDLLKVTSRLKATGYNEVMLSLAEDNVLKSMVERRILRLRDFIALSALCVAGVDMIPIPRIDMYRLRRLVLDCVTVSIIKQKPMGIRLIPTREPAGGLIKLRDFDEVPVPHI